MSECGHGNPFDRCDECAAALALEAAYDRWLSEEYDRYLNEAYEQHINEMQSEAGKQGRKGAAMTREEATEVIREMRDEVWRRALVGDGATVKRLAKWEGALEQAECALLRSDSDVRREERERCASECQRIYDERRKSREYPMDMGGLALECAAAIRALEDER